MELKKRYLGLVGIAILAFILYSLDIGKIFEVLAKTNPVILAAALALEFASILLKGLKYKIVVKAHGESIGWIESTKYFLISFFLSLITPGRIGDLARAVYVNKKINSLGKSLSTVVFDRAIDLGMLIVIGFLAALFFAFTLNVEVIPIEAVALVAIAFFGMLFIVSRRGLVRLFLRPIFYALVPERFRQNAKTGFDDFYASIKEVAKNKATIASAIGLSIVIWIMVVFVVYLYLLALGLDTVPLYFVFLLYPVLTLLEILPISFSGIGTREAGSIFMLAFYGIGAAEAVAFSVLLFAAGYALTAVAGFILFSREQVKIDLAGIQ